MVLLLQLLLLLLRLLVFLIGFVIARPQRCVTVEEQELLQQLHCVELDPGSLPEYRAQVRHVVADQAP